MEIALNLVKLTIYEYLLRGHSTCLRQILPLYNKKQQKIVQMIGSIKKQYESR
jgi:hypothetical protein